MASTHFRGDHGELIRGFANGYVPGENKKWRLSLTNFDTVGATSLITSVEDLAHWDRNFYTPKVGGDQFLDQMLHHDRLNNGELQDYAFGLVLGNYHGLPTVEHFGSDAGYRAMFIRFPDQHFAVACLCNGGPDTQPRELTHQITNLFLAKDYKPSTKLQNPPQLKPEQLKAFAGAYWNARANEVRTIIVKRGVLQVLVGEDLIPLHPLAPRRSA